ncbi:MAG: hypothetical protein QM768_09500 [Agriterribacter sp.]
MKSFVLFAAVLFFAISLKAQITLPESFAGFQSPYALSHKAWGVNADPGKKWFVSRYSLVSAGYSFFRGGSFSYISAPLGLQLNRKLNNNMYAFAGLSVVPAYINFNQPIPLSGMNKMYNSSMSGAGNFSVSPRAEMGLMYINDEKTFSISGSISVQRGSYYMPARSSGFEQASRHIKYGN